MQVPAEVAVNVVPSHAQPVAVPFATEVIESAPVPEPPVTLETVSGVCDKGALLLLVLNTGAEIALWLALLNVNVADELVAAL